MIFKKKNISSLHLPHNKHTAACVPVRIAAPKEVLIPMDMHSGHVAEPIVSVGDYVTTNSFCDLHKIISISLK